MLCSHMHINADDLVMILFQHSDIGTMLKMNLTASES